jgi:hypothetical protein
MPLDTFLFKPLNKSMVIVHYIPGFFFAKLLLKGCFSRLKFGKSMLNFKNLNSDSLTHHGDSPTHHGDSPTCGVGESTTLRLAKFSFKHSKAHSPTPRLAESESRRLAKAGSRFSITNISATSKPKAERLKR